MYFHFIDEVYPVFCDDQLITLNLKTDQYTIFSQQHSRLIAEFTGAIKKDAARQTNHAVNIVGRDHLFKPGAFNQADAKLVISKQVSLGMPDDSWRLAKEDVASPPRIGALIQALLLLRKIHRCAASKRIAGLIAMLDRQKNALRAATPSEFDSLILALNIACLLYPKKTKCLEWACALMLMGAHVGLQSSLVIGVQNRPFSAHAWVEVDGVVIGDDHQRREQLAVIYEWSF